MRALRSGEKMSKVMCVWCRVVLDTKAEPGWHSCDCDTVRIDVTKDYYKVVANFEDMEIVEL